MRGAGVEVHAIDEPAGTACPDCVFPNNWVSLHHDGTVVLYPMLAPSRRLERRTEMLVALEQRGDFAVSRLLDLSHHELSGRFLEGTGSVVFDHACRVAYACLSPRTNADVLAELCDELGYEPFAFDATDGEGVAVYHTNVLLSIGRRSAIVCAEAVPRSATCAAARAAAGRAAARSSPSIARRWPRSQATRSSSRRRTARRCSPCRTVHFAASTPAVSRLSSVARSESSRCPCRRSKSSGGGSVRCTLAEVFLPRRAAAT